MNHKSVKLVVTLIMPLLSLLFIFTISIATTAVSAQDEEFHTLKFYLHPDLVAGLTTEELNSRLTLYAEDLNTIFTQTNRQFLFDPATGVIITDTQPHYAQGGPLPTSGYEIWIHAQLSDYIVGGRPHTYGGSGSFDGPSGAGVATNLKWDAIYNRSILVDGSRDMEEYWLQIDHVVHELEHVFGAGISEYYSLATVNDTTGISPIQNVNSLDPNDPYWKEHPSYFVDPLLQNIWNRANVGSPTSYTDLMNTIHLTDLSIALINHPCRLGGCSLNTIPDLYNTKVKVMDALTGQPINGAQVNAWNIRSVPPYTPTPLADMTTNENGEIIFAWDIIPATGWFSNFNNMKLIKSSATNYQPAAIHASIFDAQERKMVYGQDEMVITLYMWPNTVYAAPDTATCGSFTPCYSGSTSIQDALNAVANNSRVLVLGNHLVNTSLQTGSSGTNQAALDGRFDGTITWTGGNGSLFTANSGSLTAVGLTVDCQSNCANSVVFNQNGGQLLAYANNIIGFNQGYTGSGTANLRHNWWGDSMNTASIGQADAYDFRLGAHVTDWETLTLGEAKMHTLNGTGIGILVSHGRGEAQAPFGKATSADGNSQCSDYYDYFTVNGSGEWLIQTPIDTAPLGCVAVHTNSIIYGFPQTVNGAPDTSCIDGACWQPLPQTVSMAHPNNIRVRLNASQLQGTPIVAGNIDGNDPTSVSLNSLHASSELSVIGAFILAISFLLTGISLGVYHRSSKR